MTTTPPLRILISGAGIAGPALALCLSRYGVSAEITIVERHHELRASGQQVDIRGQGLVWLPAGRFMESGNPSGTIASEPS